MEEWDLYDKNKTKIGKTWVRGNAIPDGFHHLVVHVWIKNSKSEYLISQRAEIKHDFPLMWECAGGAVLKGETSLQGAIRESKEEVGVDLDSNKGKIIYTMVRDTINGKRFNDIVDVWLFDYDGESDLKNATTNEVKAMKWMTKDEIKEMFDNGELVPTLDYFFKYFN